MDIEPMKRLQTVPFRNFAGALLCILCAIAFASCDESLPPRDEPVNFLLITCSMDYYKTRYEEWVYLTVRITNNYTEVFSDTTSIYGSIELIKTDDPSFQKHIDLTVADLKQQYFNTLTGQYVTSRAEYSAASKVLTLPIGQAAVVQYKWNLMSDDSVDLRKIVTFSPDAANPSLLRTKELPFTVNAGVKVYKKFPMLYLQIPTTVRLLIIKG
jgi:hypothetical protein